MPESKIVYVLKKSKSCSQKVKNPTQVKSHTTKKKHNLISIIHEIRAKQKDHKKIHSNFSIQNLKVVYKTIFGIF